MNIREWLANLEAAVSGGMREVIRLMRDRPDGENALILDRNIPPARAEKALMWMELARHAQEPGRRAFVTEALCAANGT